MTRILVLHGPNLGLLGTREPGIYGRLTLADIDRQLRELAATLRVEVNCFQSDVEGELVSRIGKSRGVYDGLILNPGAYTHTSIALRDALQAVETPCVEVHLSNTAARETFRHHSFTAAACIGQIMGFGAASYALALTGLVEYLSRKREP
ncbi:MAG: type II 3-dehydroquinate dehydratase [Lentisphaerae bacterium]|nr:type II 3-dehydroquinate dehydratase [Lentisphaerota bacterium]